MNVTYSGLEVTGFETYLKGERKQLASNGVSVVTLNAGKMEIYDPITTERGGSKVVKFEEPQASAVNDFVTDTVNTTLDTNVKGQTPDDGFSS